ncbi:PilW family protein [Neisseria perflava]|uniref:PilW family protein n=1 Tax=Neisseria perflava TaxID=33053 RepID=UPI0020A20D7E|nr:prepilin-type N-terminal cleavage/methylation domain-containing protein [Neisseria perflava]MCP1660920.1 type IV pilus assembly protein PilW [Neisseria perflava]
MNKKYPAYSPIKQQIQGFSLIEFLVASALSMIVLIAVTSTYFTARNLNTAASGRVNVQQDLRNATNLIARDAHMAGSFGCFNMSAYTAEAVLNDVGASVQGLNLAPYGSSDTTAALIPVKELSASDFSADNFTPSSSVLLFQYGVDSGNIDAIGSEITSGAPAVFSTCSTITRPSETPTTAAGIRSALGLSGSTDDGNIGVMHYTVNAYAIGTSGEQTGLFRIQLADDGSWGNPQLLIADVSSWDISYVDVTDDSCPETGATTTDSETFDSTSNLSTDATPAMIRIVINGGSISADDDNAVHVYNIDTNVRGGNTCADRAI